MLKCDVCGRVIKKCVCPSPDDHEDIYDDEGLSEFDSMLNWQEKMYQDFQKYKQHKQDLED